MNSTSHERPLHSASWLMIGQRALIGLVAGTIANLLLAFTVTQTLALSTQLLLGGAAGALFGMLLGARVITAGSGLVWGQAFGILWWLAVSLTVLPLFANARLDWSESPNPAIFTALLTQVVGNGAVLGFVYFGLQQQWRTRFARPTVASTNEPRVASRPRVQEIVPPQIRAVLVGGIGGLLGSWAFAVGIDRANFYPLVASLIGSESMHVGRSLHYVIGVTISLSFSLIFRDDIRRPGAGLVWGLNYGMLWWVLGPLTLMPLLSTGQRGEWSVAAAQAAFPSLISHLLYGALIGYVCGVVVKVWTILFIDSDPLQRNAEGAGTRSVRNLLMGIAGGVIGGLLFSLVIVSIGALPGIAQIIGATSNFVGFLVHLLISIIIGVSFGLLYQKEVDSYGAGVAWGMLYGFFWWVLGALTLYPLLFRQAPDWSLGHVANQFPSLIGHLLYGVGLGLFFRYLAQRYETRSAIRALGGNRTMITPAPTRPAVNSVAPALWAATLVFGIMVLQLLGT